MKEQNYAQTWFDPFTRLYGVISAQYSTWWPRRSDFIDSNNSMKTLLITVYCILIYTANAQPLILYENNSEHKKFVLSRTYQEGDRTNVSEIVMADTFSVQMTSFNMCQVTMSNAYVFHTSLAEVKSPYSTNAVHQEMIAGTWTVLLSKTTKIVFHDAVEEISKFTLDGLVKGS